MKKRMFSLMLVMVMLIGICPITVYASASDDYTQWKQYDSEWNQQAAWPSAQYPQATLYYMKDAGCLVTSIAMLLRHYNVVTESSVTTFNPWICNEALKAAGALNNAADLEWGKEKLAYPGFVYQGYQNYSLSNLMNLYNSGYACIVKVNGSGGYDHYVAVHSINGSIVTIMDPGGNATSLSSYSPSEIRYYSATPSTPPLVKQSHPSYRTLNITGTTYIKSLPCSEKTDASSANVEKASKGDTYQAIGLVENTAGNLWYQVNAKSGGTGYLYAGDTSYQSPNTSDITGSGISCPASHTAGQVYVLAGTIESPHNELTEVSAYIYSGSGGGNPITGGTAAVGGHSFSLAGSSIDKVTEFNILPPDTYTYVVTASYRNCYAKSAKIVGTDTGTLELYRATFHVVSGAASCSHTYSSQVTTAATCVENGVRTYTCTQCGVSYTEPISATGNHTYHSEETTKAACTTGGERTYTCDICSYSYTEEIPAAGHTPGAAPTCTTAQICTVCGETLNTGSGHTIVTTPATAPSCTETGLSEGSCCAVCQETILPQAVIPAKGHTEITIAATAPTCTGPGLTEGTYCAVCGEDLIAQTEIAPLGHRYAETVTAPSCTSSGYTTVTCTVCEDTYRTSETQSTGHTVVIDEAVAATCMEPGLTEGSHCARCGEVLTVQEVISAEHTGGLATCVSPAVCSLCDSAYGALDVYNHASDQYTYAVSKVENAHIQQYTCCGLEVTEVHKFADGLCVCGARETAEETAPSTPSYVSITLETGKKTTATQTGPSTALTHQDIEIGDSSIVSVSISAHRNTSGGWWFRRNHNTAYDHTITFEGKAEGTTLVRVGEVSYYVTVKKPSAFAPKRLAAFLSRNSVTTGKPVTLTVMASEDVEYVTINNKTVTSYTPVTSGFGKHKSSYRRFTDTVTESTAGNYRYTVCAYNADGLAANTAEELTLTVKAAGNSKNWSWFWWKK